MRWLLITTATRTPDKLNSNVGDEFARFGIQRLIREVDREAVFDLLDKEDPKAWDARPFDKAIVCGMPMFWSLPALVYPGSQNCQEVWWWPRIVRGWPSAVRENFLAWGVGHVFVDRIRSLHDYVSAIEEVLNRSWKLIVREPVLDHPRIVESICPSAFWAMGRTVKPEVGLCNLMRDGGHFGYLSKDASAWNEKLPALAKVLQDRGFVFLAHDRHERKLAQDLGWKEELIKLPTTAQGYMDWFTRAKCYIGNRMHGAAVCAAMKIPTLGICDDVRSGMVQRLGGVCLKTSEAGPAEFEEWAKGKTAREPSRYSVEIEYARMVKLLKEFMAETPKAPWTE